MEPLTAISQFRDYFLGGAAVLVLIGIAGGGKLQVKDFALGPVEWPIRLGSFLFGVVCLGLVITMPPSTSELETIDVSGAIEFNAQEGADFQIQLTPKYAVYETEVQSAGGNTGTFRFVKKLPKGQYTLFVIEKGEISDKQDISLDSKKKILIAEKNTRVTGDRFSIRQGNLLEEARTRYSTSQKWIERAKVIGVLASHARNDETVKQELMDMLKAAHLSMQEKELAILIEKLSLLRTHSGVLPRMSGGELDGPCKARDAPKASCLSARRDLGSIISLGCM